VARICYEEGQSWKIGHRALTANFRAWCSSCSMTNSFVTNAVLIERAVSCWRLHQLISQTTQCLDSWLSDLLESELKMKLWKVEGAPVPVLYRWLYRLYADRQTDSRTDRHTHARTDTADTIPHTLILLRLWRYISPVLTYLLTYLPSPAWLARR